MPVTSDHSPFTSVTVSPMDPQDIDELPIELKIPLPSSSACSDEESEPEVRTEEAFNNDPRGMLVAEEKAIPPEVSNDSSQDHHYDTKTKPQPEELQDIPRVSLEELAHLVQLEVYQRRQTALAQTKTDQLSLKCGLDRRRISTLSIAYGNMIDQYKTDDQPGFTMIYEACDQLKTSCHTDVQVSDPLELPLELDCRPAGEYSPNHSCIQMLPPDNQKSILMFLNQIRTDPKFLSHLISNLSPSELTSLTSSYHPAGIDYSVLQNHSHGKTHFYSKDSQMMNLSRRMDNLHRFHDEDPLYALLYSVFDSSAKLCSREDFRRTEIWSSTCARNFTEAFTGPRPGSEEFAIAALDGFTNFQEWPLRPKMESYLMGILTKGSFLLDQTSQQPTNTKEPIEIHRASAAVREAEFFEEALIDLFALLTTQLAQQPQQAVPERALALVHATLRKLENPDHKLRATRFIVCRWYFAMFISSIVLHPEVRGLLMAHHVGDTARQIILQQLVLQLQQRVFDVVLQGNGHALVNPDIRDGIMAVFKIFESPDLALEREALQDTEYDDGSSTRYLMLSTLDIIGLVQTLYPERATKSEIHEPGSAMNFSNRPSTAGSSTLIAGSSEVGSAEAPSTAPSSIDAFEKPTIDESSATVAHTEEQSPDHSSQSEVKNASVKTDEVAPGYLASQLQDICRKLKSMPIQEGTSIRGNAWTLLHYSQNGSTLSVSQRPGTTDSVSTELPHSKSCRTDDHDRDRLELEAAVLKLLTENSDELANFLDGSRIRQNDDRADPLQRLMERAVSRARFSLDFAAAHSWWRIREIYQDFLTSDPSNSSQTLLRDISKALGIAIKAAVMKSKACDIQCRSLVRLEHYHNNVLALMKERRMALRIKMWYSSDVRHSAIYEEALLVTRALRTMASSRRAKQNGGLSNWARQRLRGSSIHDRAESQTLEALTATKDYGGVSKLADEQIDFTSRWLTRKSIENFCKGEERIHRFCYEVQRSVGKIAGPNLLDSPVLWSSNLFRFERSSLSARPMTGVLVPPYTSHLHASNPLGFGLPQTTASVPPASPLKGLGLSKAKSPTSGYGSFWPVSQVPRGDSYHPNLPPTPTSPPNTWSSDLTASGPPLHTFTPPLTSVSGFGRHSAPFSSEGDPSPAKKAFVDKIKRNLCSLLLSDLGCLLWNQGSETDMWINEHIAQTSVDSVNFLPGNAGGDEALETSPTMTSESSASRSDPMSSPEVSTTSFPFLEAYTSLLQTFSLTRDPYVKLDALYALEDLIIRSLVDASRSRSVKGMLSSKLNWKQLRPVELSLRGKGVPRTKTTSLEEVIANCTERRAGTLNFKASKGRTALPASTPEDWINSAASTDDIVNELLRIFRFTNLRPATLFRDLQYVAAFVPSEILDQTARGKAFWDVALAALALKDGICDEMITRADEITAYHISSTKASTSTADNTLASTSLRDAANLWLIAAKEGSPIAARELGLFYLTHPELLSRTTMPFSKAKDVFKSVIAMDYRNGDKERGALDPYTFAVVRHWMEIAANGGDKDARDFLRGSGDVGIGR